VYTVYDKMQVKQNQTEQPRDMTMNVGQWGIAVALST
jgi:hypothetical protein